MTPADIIAEVALVTGVPVAAITGRHRSTRIVQARFLAIAACRQAYDWWTLESTAEEFNRRNHCTIINARARHLELLKTDPLYKSHATRICLNLFACPAR